MYLSNDLGTGFMALGLGIFDTVGLFLIDWLICSHDTGSQLAQIYCRMFGTNLEDVNMEKLWVVYELGTFEFMGTESECIDYVSRNHFKDSFFTLKEA